MDLDMDTALFRQVPFACVLTETDVLPLHVHYMLALYIVSSIRNNMSSRSYARSIACLCSCHDRDIPSQPSHIYLCLLAVQTPPEPIPGLSDPSTAFPNPSAAFPRGCCTDVCLVSIPEAVNTIPEHI